MILRQLLDNKIGSGMFQDVIFGKNELFSDFVRNGAFVKPDIPVIRFGFEISQIAF